MRKNYFLVFLLFIGITTTLNAGTWTQIEADIDGESGKLISLNEIGSLAIHSVENNNGADAGQVRIALPSISIQPTNQTDICSGDAVDFSVVADFTDSYQWQRSADGGSSWIDIPNTSIYSGTSTSTLTVTTILGLNNYQFRCILTNTGGDVTSDPATLTFETEDPATPTLSDITDECSATAVAPTTTDNCAGTVTGTTSDPLTYTTQGTHTITWTFDDGNGNSIDVDQDVVIEDVTNPTISCISNKEVVADATENTYTVTGTEFDPASTGDNCDIESIINDFNSTASLAGASLPAGTTTIKWTVTDAAGNEAECSFNVTVEDATGIRNLEELGISIYPNPTNGILKLNFAGNQVQKLNVSDITGKTVFEKTNVQQNETIDLSGFANGIYIIILETENGTFSSKIMRE